jgi:serine/threonine protein kinase
VNQQKFTILQTISEGPTTTVYRGVENALGRPVLLKVLHRHLLGDNELVERLRREAAACATLRSEHIVQVYTLDEFDGRPAIVMEFVEGESLKEYLSRTGEHSEEFARSVAAAVLRGLATAHAQGITHRDIKPANLMVLADRSVRITDFGLASVTTSPTMTAEGVLIGTPAYMSPEQARGESLDHSTDQFSLGVTLLEILTGKQIFHGTSYAECITKILRYTVADIDALKFQSSPQFRNFLKRLMAEERASRFPSADEALAALNGDRTEEHVPAARRHPARVLASLFVVAVIFTLAWMFFPSPESGRPDPSAAQPGQPLPRSTIPGTPSLQSTGRVGGDSSAAPVNSRPRTPPGRNQTILPDTRTEVQPEQHDSGDIRISSLPWAQVYLNGTYLGTTPIARNIRVPAGEHQLTFTNPLFDPMLKTVAVGPQQVLAVEADFLAGAAYLRFAVSPWAEIYIDDRYRDTTPINAPLLVSAGIRSVRLHHPAYPDRVIQVSVNVGDTLMIVHQFSTDPNP